MLCLSSQHAQPHIDPQGKPEIIEFYNATKGVDTFDQMCSVNCCSRKTKRCPLCILHGMMNAADMNSYIKIYKENMARRSGTGLLVVTDWTWDD